MCSSDLLEYHKEQNADVTIAVLEVPTKEASRFGIITTDTQNRIVKFAEKPKEPDSNLASMGIYIFSWPLLKEALMEDELNTESDNDFGKNVLPMLLQQGSRLFTFRFQGYWKDVGTIESYYEANMDLLNNQPELDIFSSDRRIFSNNEILPPQYIGTNAEINNCLVGNGCTILGKVKHSIVMPGAYVGEGAHVTNSILLPNAKVMNDCWVHKAIIGESATVGALCAVGSHRGSKPQPDRITLIADNSFLQEDYIA